MSEEHTSADKSSLRAAMLARRAALSADQVKAASQAVLDRLARLPVWDGVREALFYLPVKNEIDATGLLRSLWDKGVRILVPRCRKGQPGMLDLACIDDLAKTCPGSFGVPEPHESLCRPPDAFSPDLILVPGAVFDRKGGRIGFGGGYYDRLLAGPGAKNALTIGLAHAFQLVERLPSDPWDKPVDAVCTNKEILWIKK